MSAHENGVRAVYPTPETFRDRVAFAICAHDVGSGEGRMNDAELADLEKLIRLAAGIHGTKTRQMFRHLSAFLSMERSLRQRDGMALAHAHVIASDWPNYLGSADAAIGVMLERPEAVAQMARDASQPTGQQGDGQ